MKKSVAVMLATGLLLGTVSYGVMAQGGPEGPGRFDGPHPGGRNEFRMHSLNLTADQQKKMLEIRQQFEKETQKLRFELEKLQLEVRKLDAAQPVNQREIDQKVKAIAKLEVQLTEKGQKQGEKMEQVLTAEQRKAMADHGPQGQKPGELRQTGHFQGPDGPQKEMPGLAAEQQKKMAGIRETFQKETQGLHQQLQQKEQALRQLWESKSPNRKQLLAQTEQVIALRVKLEQQFDKMHDAMEKVLTPEQLTQLQARPQHHGRPASGCQGMDDGAGFGRLDAQPLPVR